MGYLYRFIDKNNNILYVGKTEKTLSQRFHGHHHLPTECYQSIIKIEYKEIPNKTDLSILELYYINKYLPKYNIDSKDSTPISLKLEDTYTNWKDYDFKAYGVDLTQHVYKEQKTKSKLSKEEVYKRQKEGIKKAKEQGKYKGRAPIKLDMDAFKQYCIEWQKGERTAKSVFTHFNISATTFYRKVNQWGYNDLNILLNS